MDLTFTADEFWAKVDVRGPDACWPYVGGALHPRGYGYIRCGAKRRLRTHRVAWFLTHGTWPVVVRHRCDHPPCCNPGHLLDGTQRDNIHDAIRRGRLYQLPPLSREQHPNARLTQAQVAQIAERKNAGERAEDLAKEYGIVSGYVRQLARAAR